MASASVSVTAGLPLACLGSVGRVRANGPVAAHPNRRMPRIPFRVVLELHCDAQGLLSVTTRETPLLRGPVSCRCCYFPGTAAKRLWRNAKEGVGVRTLAIFREASNEGS